MTFKIKLALTAKKYWKEILMGIAGIMLFPFFLIVIITSTFSMPFINNNEIQMYVEVAEEVGRDKTYISYSDMIGIDAVRYNQDFTKANKANVTELAKRFLKEEEETISINLKNYKEVAKKVNDKLDWRLVVQADSAIYGRDLNVDNKTHISMICEKFIKKEEVKKENGTKEEKISIRPLEEVLRLKGKTINDIPNEFRDINLITETINRKVIVYSSKTIEEVAKELGFTKEEIDLAKEYSKNALTLFSGSGVGKEFNGSQQDFINAILPGALENYKKYKIFPSLCMAQAILESGWGKSGLATRANNLFGIKAYNWNGAYVEMATTEYRFGVPYKTTAKFRKYNNFSESVVDHGKFLSENKRYANAGLFSARNYSEQAYALRKAGYATDPNYPSQLIDVIRSYNLDKYDNPNFSLENPISGLQFLEGGAKLPLYLQTDARWANKPYGDSTIGVSGCGITSVAMVVTGLTGKTVTPPEVANWATRSGYYISGVGSSWSLMEGAGKKWGLKVEQISKNNPQRIVNELSAGNPIIVSMGRGNFTRSGHIMVLRGMKNGKVMILDPYSKQKSEQLWDLSLIISQSSKKSNSPFWVYKK